MFVEVQFWVCSDTCVYGSCDCVVFYARRADRSPTRDRVGNLLPSIGPVHVCLTDRGDAEKQGY
jgi:hypothetical protein